MELTQFEEGTKYDKIANHLRRTGNLLSVLAAGCHLDK